MSKKMTRMTDEELEGKIEVLSKELDRRRVAKAKAAEITLSDDPADYRDDRTVFNTPLGTVLVWSNSFEGGDIRIGETDATEFIFDHGPEEWVSWAEGEIGDDARSVLDADGAGARLHEFMKLYEKYGSLLRQMSVHAVQNS